MLIYIITDKVPRRAILGVLMFFACMFSYVIRTNLSINIVAMVNNTGKAGTTKGPYCTSTTSNLTIVNIQKPDVRIIYISHGYSHESV